MVKYIKTIIVLFLLVSAGSSLAKPFGQIDEPKFILLPLPFYGPSTGAGMTLKLLHTNVGAGTFVDMTGFATTESMIGVFATVGQKHVPSNKRLFWSMKVEELKVEQKIYGIGNRVPSEGEATFMLRSNSVEPRVGYYILENFKVFAKIRHSKSKLSKFKDGEHGQQTIWDDLTDKSISTTELGGGVTIESIDDDVRPMKGYRLRYEYGAISPKVLGNERSYRRASASLAIYVPLAERWSQGIHAKYESISCSAAFYKYPTVEVRGIDSERHNNCKSMVLQNESRIYFKENWAFTPFFDLGKVSEHAKTSLTDDLHYGGGAGVRYIIKDALVVRVDYGVSRGGESSFVFNYGHTF